MPRDIPVGNRSLLINVDRQYQVRDIYWPHVGQENHTAGHPCRFGVWVDGQFRWLSAPRWQRHLGHLHCTLVTDVELYHPELDVRLVCHDAVDFDQALYLRQITVHNGADRQREVRLFFAHDLHISGFDVGDSAYYEPLRLAVFHYKAKQVHPYTNEPLSVSPLTWSHAAFVATVHALVERRAALAGVSH